MNETILFKIGTFIVEKFKLNWEKKEKFAYNQPLLDYEQCELEFLEYKTNIAIISCLHIY